MRSGGQLGIMGRMFRRLQFFWWEESSDALVAALADEFPDVGADLDVDRRVIRLTGGDAGADRINEFYRALSGHAHSGLPTEADIRHFGQDYPKHDEDQAWASYQLTEDGKWAAYCEMCSWSIVADNAAGIRVAMRTHDENVHHLAKAR